MDDNALSTTAAVNSETLTTQIFESLPKKLSTLDVLAEARKTVTLVSDHSALVQHRKELIVDMVVKRRLSQKENEQFLYNMYVLNQGEYIKQILASIENQKPSSAQYKNVRGDFEDAVFVNGTLDDPIVPRTNICFLQVFINNDSTTDGQAATYQNVVKRLEGMQGVETVFGLSAQSLPKPYVEVMTNTFKDAVGLEYAAFVSFLESSQNFSNAYNLTKHDLDKKQVDPQKFSLI
jgi:hypothetical protein